MTRSGSWRQAALLTAGAAGVLAVLHFLPAGPILNHMDFLADKASILQFCDPHNVRPLPVVAGRPAVTLSLAPGAVFAPGVRSAAMFTLTTISEKPVGPEDLLSRDHSEVRLQIAGPAGMEILIPRVARGREPGQWLLDFAPPQAGDYRITAVFTPRATLQEITAATDLKVAGTGVSSEALAKEGGPPVRNTP